MKITLTEFDFIDGFRKCERSSSFSYEGYKALFGYLEEYEADCGTQIEYDPIAICCEFDEYDAVKEAAANYGWIADDGDALSFLRDKGTVIEIPGTDRVIFAE